MADKIQIITMAEEQIIITNSGLPVYGMLYMPDSAVVGSIVLCNPIFEERKSANRALVETARYLRNNGFAVLRFDYRGCGDSAGKFNNFSPEDWVADINNAADFLRQYVSNSKGMVCLLGLRLGSALALNAAINDTKIDSLVLWEPVVSGQNYIEQELRKKLVKQMVTFGQSKETRSAILKNLKQGREIDFDGYPVSPTLYRELCDIDMIRSANTFQKHVLIVHVTSRARPSKPICQLRDAFTTAAEIKLQIIKQQPFWNLIGYVDCFLLISETEKWIKSFGVS